MIFFHRFCFYKCINNLLLFKQISKKASIIETAIGLIEIYFIEKLSVKKN